MSKMTAEKLLKYADKGFSERDSNLSIYDEIETFCSPYSDNIYNNNNDQTFEDPTVLYDSVGLKCMNDFINNLSKNITPKDIPFIKLTVGPLVRSDEDKNKLTAVLGYINDIMYAYLSASNFYVEVANMFREIAMGTGILWLHEGTPEKPFRFASSRIADIGLTMGNDGQIDKIFRKVKMDVNLLQNMYTGSKLNIPKSLKDQCKGGKTIELLECQYYDYNDMTWNFTLIHRETKVILLEKSFKERMCFTPRWMTTSGKALGIGPFMQALPDIKTVNRARDLQFQHAEMAIYNMYTVESSDDFNPNNVVMEPGALIAVAEQGKSIVPLPTTGDPRMQELLDRELKDDIKDITMNAKLPEQQATPASAFEIAQRIKEFTDDYGVVYAIMLHEFIEPMAIRMLGILERQGIINLNDLDLDIPEGLKLETLIDNLSVKVTITSPLGQIQALNEVEVLTQYLSLTNQLTANPTVVTALGCSLEQVPFILRDLLQPPEKILNTDLTPETLKENITNAMEKAAAQQNEPDPNEGQ